MMKQFFTLFFSFVWVLFLNACASPVNSVSFNQEKSEAIWQQRQQSLSTIQDWHMKGRMVVVNGVELWSMSVDWKQQGEQFVIFLAGPFGAGKVQLAGGVNGVLLKNADEQVFYAETPEELLLEHTGVAMPLSLLRFWMLGLPNPKDMKNQETLDVLKLDALGRLESLSLASNGSLPWDINFLRYTSIDKTTTSSTTSSATPMQLPEKIFINQGADIKVRVVVGEWLFDNSSS